MIMKKNLIKSLLILVVTTTFNVSAQNPPLSLPLGIDVKSIPPGDGIRKGGDKEATRFLENAVRENNRERVEKLLKAGASAFVSYEMIDKKQYEIMEIMHRNNPLLIRFSQMIHYACANSDSTMVDFLVNHGACLDLCGNYWETFPDRYWGRFANTPYSWNSDGNLYYTPLDCALRSGKISLIRYITKKYGKRPTVTGVAEYLYNIINADEYNNDNVKKAINELPLLDELLGGNALSQVFNNGVGWISYHATYQYLYGYNSLLVLVVEKLGKYRDWQKGAKAAKFEQLFQIMLDKNVDVNQYSHRCSLLQGYKITANPMSTAMSHSGMIDIIHELKNRGASTKPLPNVRIRDEYKEMIILGEL